MSASTTYFSHWRIGVCGSSHDLPPMAEEMCEAIGEQLGALATVKVVHSGLKRRAGAKPGTFAADWHFIEGVRRTMRQPADDRIETILAEYDVAGPGAMNVDAGNRQLDPQSGAEMFIAGRVVQYKARNREARRFRFVNALDAVIGLGGGVGTRQQLTLGSAIDIPVLPVPSFGGTAARFWKEHRGDLMGRLGIDETTALQWEETPRTQEDIYRVATDMVQKLMLCLPRRCFVIMPYDVRFDTLYDLVIEPSVNSLGDTVMRLDRIGRPGAVIQQIEDGIRSADYCIVVLDGMRPNVLYEMGMAQALGKPLAIIMQKGALGDEAHVPFDISTLQRIEYERPDKDTLIRLRQALQHLVNAR